MTAQPPISREAAAAALDAVDRARGRSRTLGGYARAGDALVVWGLVWVIGNGTAQWLPARASVVWSVGIAVAALWSMSQRGRSPSDWRIPASVGTALGFAWLVAALFHIGGPRATDVLISLAVAAGYLILGIWTGIRFAVLGLVIVAAILLGWFAFPAWLYLWLGIGGGGTLIVGGWWLRRA